MNPINVNVWLSNPQNVLKLSLNNPNALIDQVILASESVDMSHHGWALLGKARVEFDINPSPQNIQLEAIKALGVGLKKLNEEYGAKRNIFLEAIDKLQAIEYCPEGRSEGDEK